ncbi:hypothetical protein Sango_2748400 [Sesamum angolense]|uniref:Retrotransposon gag domain-containing protein n=1 Tax=Sesamum angolense TaxID=2727404 RepID=A0AAE1W068_9LAMI|nr:hypothetical protein Sango_2748400 [Sesamum angolense]
MRLMSRLSRGFTYVMKAEVELMEINTISPSGVDLEVSAYRGLGPNPAFSQVGPGANIFAGTIDPAEAEEWLRNTERVLDRIECSPQQKLRNLLTNITPPVYRNRKKVEFLELKQNELSVAGYELQFVRLSKYAPEKVSTDELRRDRVVQFLLGVLVYKEVGIEAEEWVRLAGLLQCFLVEEGLTRSDLGEDRVQPDHSVEDIPSCANCVGDTLVNVGELSQLCVIVAINRDIL